VVAQLRQRRASRTSSRPLVLIVDPDRVSAMVTTRMLEKASCDAECAVDATGGMEILQQREVALLICEATLPDLPAAAFISKVQRAYAPVAMPVLVTAMHLRLEARLELLRSGALELIAKPIEAEELRLRVLRALHRPADQLAPPASIHLCSDLSVIRVAELLTTLELARYSGRLEVASNHHAGFIELREGRICHAVLGKATGLEALAEILTLKRGGARARHAAPGEQRTLEGSTTQILLEASVADANQRRAAPRELTLEELGVSRSHLNATPLIQDRARLAARLALQLDDPHRLGELELNRRTTPAPAPPEASLTLTAFGEAEELLVALWELSAPLGPELLLAARRSEWTPRWTFCGRDRDQLIVRVISLDEPAASWAQLASDVVIVAVPSSGPLLLDPAIRTYVMNHQLPTLVIGSKDDGAQLLPPSPFLEVQIAGRRLSERHGQMRPLLAAALRLLRPA
jgi:DNA-binding response OmpR family regulator